MTTYYYLPALASGSDFRSAVNVNYHNNIGYTVQPANPLDISTVKDNGTRVWNNGSMRACSTARGAVALACCFSVRALSDCSFFKVTGTPIAEVTECNKPEWDLGTVYGFIELTVVEEISLDDICTLAGLPAGYNGLGKPWRT